MNGIDDKNLDAAAAADMAASSGAGGGIGITDPIKPDPSTVFGGGAGTGPYSGSLGESPEGLRIGGRSRVAAGVGGEVGGLGGAGGGPAAGGDERDPATSRTSFVNISDINPVLSVAGASLALSNGGGGGDARGKEGSAVEVGVAGTGALGVAGGRLAAGAGQSQALIRNDVM